MTGYYNRHEESSRDAAAFTGTSFFESPEKLIAASDAIFLTVPDSEIKNTYDSLSKESLKGKMMIHCSGSLGAEDAFPDAVEKKYSSDFDTSAISFRRQIFVLRGTAGCIFLSGRAGAGKSRHMVKASTERRLKDKNINAGQKG